jgi:hypothetical protein
LFAEKLKQAGIIGRDAGLFEKLFVVSTLCGARR